MSEQRKAIFLSYASQDAGAARRICDALRTAGIEVWFDQSELRGGDAWDQKIRRQIKECALFVPIISANTQARLEGYFRLEWKLAEDRSHLMAKGKPFIVPVCIDETKDWDAHVPDAFMTVQWTRLPGGDAGHAFGARIRALLDGAADARTPPAAMAESRASPAPRQNKGRRRRMVAIALIGAAVAASFAISLWRPWKAPNQTMMTEAQRLVAQARVIFDQGDELKRENYFLAEELLKRALALDVTEATASALYARVCANLVNFGHDATDTRRQLARTHADRAISLAPRFLESQLAREEVLMTGSRQSAQGSENVAEIEERLMRLGETTPSNANLWSLLARCRSRRGDAEGALMALDRAESLGGYRPKILAERMNVLWWAGRYAEIEPAVREAMTDPAVVGRIRVFDVVLKLHFRGDAAAATEASTTWPAWLRAEDRGAIVAGQAWLWSNRPERALEIIQQIPRDYLRDFYFTGPRAVLTALAHELAGHGEAAHADWQSTLERSERELASAPDDAFALHWKAWALARQGDKTAALAILRQLQQRNATSTNYWAATGGLAGLAIVAGDLDTAMTELRREVARKGRSPIRGNLRINPIFEPLRARPDFTEVINAAPGPANATRAESAKAAAAKSAGGKSVAVLAFENLSGDKDNEYFSDGISEELLNVLAKVPGLRVAARTSAFYFKGTKATAQEIGQKLGVAHLVEGSVQKAGTKVRIRARLSKAETGEQVWSEGYERELKDVFAVQTELAETIVEQLRERLGGTDGAQARTQIRVQVQDAQRGGTRVLQAHQLYLQGKFFLNQFADESTNRAVELLERAVDIDPKFALAWSALAYAARRRAGFAGTAAELVESMALARRAVDRAITLEPDLADAHVARCHVQRCSFDWQGARESLKRAQALAPDDVNVVREAGDLAFTFGRITESIALAERAVARDPVNASVRIGRGFALGFARRFSESNSEFRQAIEISPTVRGGRFGLCVNLLVEGRFDSAASEAEREAHALRRLMVLSMAQWARNRHAEADAAIRELIQTDADTAAYQIAEVYAFRRENDRAFEWLDRALRQRDPGLTLTKVDLLLEPLHADPRWPAFLRKLGLHDEQLK